MSKSRASVQYWTFIIALVAVSLTFLALLEPFYQPIFWGVTLVLLFWPVHRRLLALMPNRPALAALISLLACLVLVVLPLFLIGMSLIKEAARMYMLFMQSGGLEAQLQRLTDSVPAWANAWWAQLQTDELAAIQQRISQAAEQGVRFIALRMVGIGQNTLQLLLGFVVMLYLMFFFFMDGPRIVRAIRAVIPIDPVYQQQLLDKFVTVVKATVRGNVVVAVIQGALGGFMFWIVGVQGVLLWAVVMGVLSLLPAVGTWLVWGPVAIYMLATGDYLKGVFVLGFGIGVVSLVDNLLRPILIGKETRMPDYLILLSTLGGLSLFGLTGFVAGPVIAALFLAMWQLAIPRRVTEKDPALEQGAGS